MPRTMPGDALGHHAAAGDVVGHEQRLGADHDDVVDDHAHQVEPDGVVDVERLRDGDLGADAVGRRGQQRLAVRQQRARVVQPGEAADAAEHLRAVRRAHGVLHQLDGLVTGLGVDAGGGVRDLRAAHGWSSALAPPALGTIESRPSSGAPSGSSFCSSRNLPSRSSGGSSIGY